MNKACWCGGQVWNSPCGCGGNGGGGGGGKGGGGGGGDGSGGWKTSGWGCWWSCCWSCCLLSCCCWWSMLIRTDARLWIIRVFIGIQVFLELAQLCIV